MGEKLLPNNKTHTRQTKTAAREAELKAPTGVMCTDRVGRCQTHGLCNTITAVAAVEFVGPVTIFAL